MGRRQVKWFLLVIFLSGSQPREYVAFFGDTEKECVEAKELVEKKAKDAGARIYAVCHPWEAPPPEKPKGDPATEKRS